MRTTILAIAVILATPALSGQSLKLAGPPLVARQSHVGDGAAIGAAIGGFVGAFAGLANRRNICPAKEWICGGPGQPVLSMLGGLAVGGIAGGATGAIVGAFIKTSPKETQVGFTVHV